MLQNKNFDAISHTYLSHRAIIGQERERSAYTIIDGEDFQDADRSSDSGVSGEWEDSERQPILSMSQPDS